MLNNYQGQYNISYDIVNKLTNSQKILFKYLLLYQNVLYIGQNDPDFLLLYVISLTKQEKLSLMLGNR